jgi:hypothetical protein
MSKILYTKGICGVIIVEENDDEVSELVTKNDEKY